VFPVIGSLLSASLFPRSGPSESGSPTSQVVLRCYDFPPTHSRSLIWFASGPARFLRSSCSRDSAPERTEDPRRARILVQPAIPLFRAFIVWTEPTTPRPWRSRRCCPCSFDGKRFSDCHIGATRGASAPAVYASRGMLPLAVQDPLPVGWLAFAGREFNRLDRDEGFPSCYMKGLVAEQGLGVTTCLSSAYGDP
jgi:hypothetical protein